MTAEDSNGYCLTLEYSKVLPPSERADAQISSARSTVTVAKYSTYNYLAPLLTQRTIATVFQQAGDAGINDVDPFVAKTILKFA